MCTATFNQAQNYMKQKLIDINFQSRSLRAVEVNHLKVEKGR